MLTTWMLLGGANAWACDWLEDDDERAKCERPLAIPGGEPPPPAHAGGPPPPPPQAQLRVEQEEPEVRVTDRREARTELELRYGMQFLANAPAHHGYARIIGKKDAYLGAEVRYLPANNLMWTGRVGAGFDIFGKSPLDVTLGLWLGGAGTWDFEQNLAVLQNAPAAGTEIAVGTKIGRFFGKYRWLGGIAAFPANGLLTENELTIGYSLVDEIQLYGQYLRVSPQLTDQRGALGIGIQATL